MTDCRFLDLNARPVSRTMYSLRLMRFSSPLQVVRNSHEEETHLPYSELLIKGMREDLTNVGVRETRTPAEVDSAITDTKGTIMVIVNSVCGCAAGKARPGVALALQHKVKPD
ncbi:MAG: BrxA/BrxB family bacilliredoxin, partial [Blastocatellia bacterium]